MVRTLNLWLDPRMSYTWRQWSLITVTALGHGINHAWNIHTWIHQYLRDGSLPLHHYGHFHSSILEDEDFAHELQLYLMEISKAEKYIRDKDVVDYVVKPEVQEKLAAVNGEKPVTISARTGRRWLKKLSWRYTRVRKGMYIDGHEREDIVAYRNGFVVCWKEYEKCMTKFDEDGNPIEPQHGFPVPQTGCFKLILVTHDKPMFYANDRRKTKWVHKSEKAKPLPKGKGSSIMISDFLIPEWGCLTDHNDEARVIFKAGKNRDGWFDGDDLMKQVENAVNVFKARTNGFANGLFLLNNAPSHQRHADDALSARKMPKGPHEMWRLHKDGPKMCPGVNPSTGKPQEFYWPDNHPTTPGWFKGMQQIIVERGLWPAKGLQAKCEGFQYFVAQKSRLEEYIKSHGHICDFYPKYHCELNFIEQYWGAAKLQYREMQHTLMIEAMEENVLQCLDSVPLQQIQWCV
ncbi:hypothetical protein C8Q72DRAFT_890182 [Fomitopsis betulina]|nr:hypothetical protein C8Q72DRAFT_890182 [Fomitopsis betulina]